MAVCQDRRVVTTSGETPGSEENEEPMSVIARRARADAEGKSVEARARFWRGKSERRRLWA